MLTRIEMFLCLYLSWYSLLGIREIDIWQITWLIQNAASMMSDRWSVNKRYPAKKDSTKWLNIANARPSRAFHKNKTLAAKKRIHGREYRKYINPSLSRSIRNGISITNKYRRISSQVVYSETDSPRIANLSLTDDLGQWEQLTDKTL